MGIVKHDKAEAWILNMLKIFRAMQAPKIQWVRLASCVLEEEAAFWLEVAQSTNFVRSEIDRAESIVVVNVTYYSKQVREQKGVCKS